MGTFKKVGPGILLCVVVGMAAFGLSRLSFIPLDGVTLAILLGLVAGNLMGSPVVFQGGIKFSEKKVLTWAIALLGLSLDYRTFLSLGLSS
ncbi:MAG: putative sulfate exporter family transporter, partial [Alkalispirochaeta sp.]